MASELNKKEKEEPVSSSIGSQIQSTTNFFTSSDKVCPINDEEQKQPSASVLIEKEYNIITEQESPIQQRITNL
ncbi:hypothetical protein B566_EDAN014724 [Ephemera danica]|nr:hypothetical protein B566_EDAN014724 [Ephemera danica]